MVNSIDNSQIQTYKSCPRLYYNKYVLGLKKRIEDEGHQSRNFGHCIHQALYIWQNKSLDDGIKWFKDNYQALPDEKVRTVNNGVILLNNYVKWEKVNFANVETLQTEIKDTYKINDIEYIVKIDRVIKLNGNIYCLDYKTTKSITHYYFNNFQLNSQVDGYCNHIRKKYGQCSGFIPVAMQLNYIDKPKTFFLDQEYEAKAYEFNETRYHRIKKQDMIYAWGFWYRFDYDIVNRTREQLIDFERDLYDWVGKLNNDKIFPKNTNNCSSYYGCEFQALCKALGDEGVMLELYETCNPYEYLEDSND